MKKLLKRLTPNAFRRIDDYLLRNYPTIWRTQGHIVFPLAVFAFPVLFAAGYFLPENTFLEPLVDPIKPIKIIKGSYFLIFLFIAFIAVFYWGYRQYQYRFDNVKPLNFLTTLLIYGVSLFVILGLDTTAYRLGTIIRTAALMDKDDLKYVEDNDCFLYGFFPHDSIKRGHEAEYFKNDTVFKSIWRHQNALLMKRYNRKPLSRLSYLSNRPYLSNLSKLSYLSGLSYRKHLSDLSPKKGSKRFIKDNDAYNSYYKNFIYTKIDTNKLNDYGF